MQMWRFVADYWQGNNPVKKQLLVRDIGEALVKALKQPSAKNGRGTEAEHPMILENALRGPGKISLAEALIKIPTCGEDVW